ncbi:hypothetical protein [Nitratiruptor sp. SB155-2]|uniref:hypothetical protein n=1 Tax=Nitratiruptor sp. (strain SB155-2) TaxID=387092 RepID=UPI00015873F8|nr:hypothetical protein [Nitratiruptor sp. SB155-2]BAF70495.1 hypothetical protein NIS_1387 [Nitratiruptor sp. SB155-2]
MLTRDDVAGLYIALFQRAPSKSELDTWYNDVVANNRDLADTAETMLQAAQLAVNGFGLQDLYPQYANVDPSNPESVREIISTVYETLFNKTYQEDPQGVDSWVDLVVSGQQSLGEAIAGITYIGEGIATKPDEYRPYFATDDDFNKAYVAAKAYEAKKDAALEVADTIENVKVDKDTLQKMQEIIEDVKDETDLDEVKNIADYLKDIVEDPNTVSSNDLNDQNSSQIQNNLSDDTYNDAYGYNFDTDAWPSIMMELQMLPVEGRVELVNLMKEAVDKYLSLAQANVPVTQEYLEQWAALDNEFEHKRADIYQKHGLPYFIEESVADESFLNLDPNIQRTYFQLEKDYLPKLKQELQYVDPMNVDSFYTLFKLEDEMTESQDKLTSGVGPTYIPEDNYYDFDNTQNSMDNYYNDQISYGDLATADNNALDNDLTTTTQTDNYNANAMSALEDMMASYYAQGGAYCDNIIASKLTSTLSQDQLVSLAKDIQNYVFTSPYFQDGQITYDEYQPIANDMIQIYNKYGIDLMDLASDCYAIM